mgnify:CR=1 FL=1
MLMLKFLILEIFFSCYCCCLVYDWFIIEKGVHLKCVESDVLKALCLWDVAIKIMSSIDNLKVIVGT